MGSNLYKPGFVAASGERSIGIGGDTEGAEIVHNSVDYIELALPK